MSIPKRFIRISIDFKFSIQFAVNNANNYLNVKMIQPNVIDVFVGSDSTTFVKHHIHILLQNEYGV